MPTWPGLLTALLRSDPLDAADASWAMRQVMEGEATPAQVGAFAVALRAKGESPEEVGGLVEAMLAAAAPLHVEGPSVDTCGTGGDRAHTVNISTMAALVVAGAGAQVVKHGNRAASSACGSADLLEELGVVVDLAPPAVAACVAEAGIGFCFAPVFHPGMRHAAAPRRELGIPTVFNFLGPLTNPARPDAQAVGCSDPRLAGVMAGVLAARGSTALVFRGDDGLDELTPTTTSRVWVVAGGGVEETSLDPRDFGIAPSTLEDLRGGDAARNAAAARALLAGERGPVRDAVVLNAAAAIAVRRGLAGVGDLPGALRDGVQQAGEALDSGAAGRVLERWVAVSRRLSGR